MIGGILFIVIEFKRYGLPDVNDNIAQFFFELLSAAEHNKQLDFEGLRIYGLLTDLKLFKFYSYNPTTSQFCSDECILGEGLRVNGLSIMTSISNKIFGIILWAYMEGLRAIISRNKNRAKCNDFTSESFAPIGSKEQSASSDFQQPGELIPGVDSKRAGGHKLTDQWEVALELAELCVVKFKEPVASLEDIEAKGNDALGLLTKSTHSIPRASIFSGQGSEPSTPAELKLVAACAIKEEYEGYLSKISQ